LNLLLPSAAKRRHPPALRPTEPRGKERAAFVEVFASVKLYFPASLSPLPPYRVVIFLTLRRSLALRLSLFAALNCHRVPLEELISFVGRTRAVMNGVDDGISDYSGTPKNMINIKKKASTLFVCMRRTVVDELFKSRQRSSSAEANLDERILRRRLGEKFVR
jgi:hypothetical protein